MKTVILFLGFLTIGFNLSAQEMTEKETKAIHKEHKKAEKKMKRAEKKHKKAEKKLQKKEKAQKSLEKAREKYQDSEVKYKKLKKKGKLDIEAEDKWLNKLDKLNTKIIKAEEKLKRA